MKSNHNCYLFVYIEFFLGCLHSFFNSHLYIKDCKVNIYNIEKYIFNVVFTLVKFFIKLRLNATFTVVYLLICILFVCLFTSFISIISWSLKLEQLTPPCWLCHAYLKVIDILYNSIWSYYIYVPKISILVVFSFYIMITRFQP